MSFIRRFLNRINSHAPKGIIESTKDWIDSQKHIGASNRQTGWYETIETAESRNINMDSAQPLSPVDRFLKESYIINSQTQFSGQTLYCFSNARVLGSTANIISPDGYLFNDLGYAGIEQNSKLPDIFYRRRFPKLVRLKGKYLNLCFTNSKNYYHWLIESLPNVRSVESLIEQLDGVLIPIDSSFQKESLEILGFKSSKFVELSQNSHFVCEELYYPSFNSGYTPFTWYPEWIKSKVLGSDNGSNSNTRQRKLFITRKQGNGRKLANEDEVFALVKRHGFEKFDPCEYSFIEQAKAYNQASAIISVHGAGLANIVFCEPGTKVLEIFPAFWTPLCYFQLAHSISLDYHFMLDLPLDTSQEILKKHDQIIEPDETRFQGDLTAPLNKIDLFLNRL